eukprot:328761-Hanusia_phi.AAC.1
MVIKCLQSNDIVGAYLELKEGNDPNGALTCSVLGHVVDDNVLYIHASFLLIASQQALQVAVENCNEYICIMLLK